MVLSSKSSCTLGAPGCAACSGSTTAGRSSTSIVIRSTASYAIAGLSATTTATGWPTNPTVPMARACCTGSCKPGAAATQGIVPTLPRMSSPVRTATTPGCCRAASTCRSVMRAWAYGLRKKAACSVPAIGISSTYCPKPWINAGSSRRLIRAPTNLGRIAIASSLLGLPDSQCPQTTVTIRGRNIQRRASGAAGMRNASLHYLERDFLGAGINLHVRKYRFVAVLKLSLEVQRLYLLLNGIEQTKYVRTDNLFVFRKQLLERHRHETKINLSDKMPPLLSHLRCSDHLLSGIDKRDALQNHTACPDVSVNTAESRARLTS